MSYLLFIFAKSAVQTVSPFTVFSLTLYPSEGHTGRLESIPADIRPVSTGKFLVLLRKVHKDQIAGKIK